MGTQTGNTRPIGRKKEGKGREDKAGMKKKGNKELGDEKGERFLGKCTEDWPLEPGHLYMGGWNGTKRYTLHSYRCSSLLFPSREIMRKAWVEESSVGTV